MINYLHKRIVASGWMPSSEMSFPHQPLGVLLRISRGNYISSPEDPAHPLLLGAVIRLNLAVAFTMRSQMLDGILAKLPQGQSELRFKDGSQIQILDSMASAQPSNVRKFQYGCIFRDERVLLTWQDSLQHIISQGNKFEEKLLSMVWGESSSIPANLLQMPSRPPSIYSGASTPAGAMTPNPINAALSEKTASVFASQNPSEDDITMEKDDAVDRPESLERPVMHTSAIFIGLSVCLSIILLWGVYISKIVSECLLDGNWVRMALIAPIPLLMCVSLFFFQIVLTNLTQMIGPIGGVHTNSRYYSCYKPSLKRAFRDGLGVGGLPLITIQMPVYKEGLEGVIMPTVRSLQAAISHYESHGGSANILINEDGLRAGISDEEAQNRRDFYHDNNIGWVARPKHGADGYVRKGKFKKASNMNFALNLSQRVENHLEQLVNARLEADGATTISEETQGELYDQALAQTLEEEPLAWAEGNVRVGEIILIVDCDTRVPEDCLLYGAAEMFLSPEVAIVQHSTGVMQVAYDYFENGIAFFTNLIYSSINFSIGSGEVAPFVGHNAFLRWAAIQDIGVKESDNYTAFWSESHVSEDFDVALRLQMAGSVVRIANYHNNEFKEGVSLTIYDEIARWQKYSYGVSELIFRPFRYWYKGPFTPMFYTFIGSDLNYSSKISIWAYMCSYYALGSALMLTIMNYFVVGWFRDDISACYLTSWNVFLSLVVVFNASGPIALAILRYRTGEKSLLGGLVENFKWTALMTVLFGGLSFHISAAFLAHLFSVDMTWGSTSKEKVESNFFQEMPKIFKTFWIMYAFIVIMTGAMIYLGAFAPADWAINDFTVVLPLAFNLFFHALCPIVLNPNLMVFNY